MPRARLLVLLLASAADSALARKVLCLHGLGGSAFSFVEMHLKPLRGAAAASYKDWRPVAWEFEAVDAAPVDTLSGGWWDYSPPGSTSVTADELVKLDSAVQLVEETLMEGGFCGIFGFSQGGMLASIVAARAALGESTCKDLRFVVACGVALPKPAEPLMHRLRDAPEADCRPIATLFVLSKSDDDQPSASGEALAGCFHDSQVIWHDRGHRLPEDYKQIVAFMDEVGPDMR